jgi:hypothetical protein
MEHQIVHFESLFSMYKSFVECCILLASVAAFGAQPSQHRSESNHSEAQVRLVEREAHDQRKALRAALVAQKDTPGQLETIPATPRQLTPGERALLREQLRHQIPQMR